MFFFFLQNFILRRTFEKMRSVHSSFYSSVTTKLLNRIYSNLFGVLVSFSQFSFENNRAMRLFLNKRLLRLLEFIFVK